MTRALAVLAWLFAVAPATAQSDAVADRAPVRRPELAVGGLWFGGAGLGQVDASLLANQSGSAPPPYRLFSTASRMAGAAGLEVRAGVALSRAWSVEMAGVFARPEVRTTVSDDVEGGLRADARERLDQYVFEVGVMRHLRAWTIRGRAVPFVAAGGGYLRQLHDDRYLVETGQIYRAGGGLTWWLGVRGHGFGRAVAVRVDGRAYVTRGGFRFAGGARVHPAVGATVLVIF